MSKLKLSFSINMFLPLCYQYLIKVPQSMWLLDPFWLFFTLFFSAAQSLQSCPTLCDPIDGSPPGSPSLGFSRQEHWSALPFPSPMRESEKWKGNRSAMSDSLRPHRLQPTRLLHPWDFLGKSTGVGCHCLLLEGSNITFHLYSYFHGASF